MAEGLTGGLAPLTPLDLTLGWARPALAGGQMHTPGPWLLPHEHVTLG